MLYIYKIILNISTFHKFFLSAGTIFLMIGFYRGFKFLVFVFLHARLADLHLIVSLFSRHTLSWTFHTFFLGFIFFLGPALFLSFLASWILFSIFLLFTAASIKSLCCLAYIRVENDIGNQSGERFTILQNGGNWLLRVTSFPVYFAAAFITGSGRISSAAAAGSLSIVSSALSFFFIDVALFASLLAFWFTIILSFYWILAERTLFVGFLAILTIVWLGWTSWHTKMLRIRKHMVKKN